MTDEIRINDWNDFNQHFNDYEVKYSKIDWLFRGQSNENWKLESSIYRIIGKIVKSEEEARGYEAGSIKKFFSEYLLYQNENDTQASVLSESAAHNPYFRHLVYMQHHASPTRLLDWTESPYIALYFAVIDNLEDDGALFLVKTEIMQTTKCDILGECAQYHVPYIECFSDWVKTRRVAIQQGWFTISNRILFEHGKILDNSKNTTEDFSKIIISKDFKREALYRLHLMNISAKTLFPGLDGLGAWTKEKMITGCRAHFPIGKKQNKE